MSPREHPLPIELKRDRTVRVLRVSALVVAVVGVLAIIWGVAVDDRSAPTARDLAEDIASAMDSGPDLIGDMTACTQAGPQRWTCTVADPQSSGSVSITATTDEDTLTWNTCWNARRTQATNEGYMPQSARPDACDRRFSHNSESRPSMFGRGASTASTRGREGWDAGA